MLSMVTLAEFAAMEWQDRLDPGPPPDDDETTSEVDQLIDRQSSEPDTGKRKQIVWEIERKLAEDAARPSLFYPMSAACWQPYFKGHTMMVNGNYNGWRLEDAWLDK